MTAHDDSELRAVVEAYRQAFLTLDPEAFSAIWSRDHAPLIYIAMEKPAPLRGWPAIERYLRELPQHLAAVAAMTIDELVIDVVGDAALACFEFTARVELKAGGWADPSGRVTMLLHRHPRWRVVHYHESALAAFVADRMRGQQRSRVTGRGSGQ